MGDTSKLFTTSDGSPMRFSVARMAGAETLRVLIEQNGGVVVDPHQPNIHVRISHPTLLSAQNSAQQLLSREYILSALSNRRLPDDVTPFRLAQARKFAGRTPFSNADDALLIDLLIQNDANLSGNDLYKKLAAKYPHHTMHSWRDRAIKKLLPVLQRSGELERLRSEYKKGNATAHADATGAGLGLGATGSGSGVTGTSLSATHAGGKPASHVPSQPMAMAQPKYVSKPQPEQAFAATVAQQGSSSRSNKNVATSSKSSRILPPDFNTTPIAKSARAKMVTQFLGDSDNEQDAELERRRLADAILRGNGDKMLKEAEARWFERISPVKRDSDQRKQQQQQASTKKPTIYQNQQPHHLHQNRPSPHSPISQHESRRPSQQVDVVIEDSQDDFAKNGVAQFISSAADTLAANSSSAKRHEGVLVSKNDSSASSAPSAPRSAALSPIFNYAQPSPVVRVAAAATSRNSGINVRRSQPAVSKRSSAIRIRMDPVILPIHTAVPTTAGSVDEGKGNAATPAVPAPASSTGQVPEMVPSILPTNSTNPVLKAWATRMVEAGAVAGGLSAQTASGLKRAAGNLDGQREVEVDERRAKRRQSDSLEEIRRSLRGEGSDGVAVISFKPKTSNKEEEVEPSEADVEMANVLRNAAGMVAATKFAVEPVPVVTAHHEEDEEAGGHEFQPFTQAYEEEETPRLSNRINRDVLSKADEDEEEIPLAKPATTPTGSSDAVALLPPHAIEHTQMEDSEPLFSDAEADHEKNRLDSIEMNVEPEELEQEAEGVFGGLAGDFEDGREDITADDVEEVDEDVWDLMQQFQVDKATAERALDMVFYLKPRAVKLLEVDFNLNRLGKKMRPWAFTPDEDELLRTADDLDDLERMKQLIAVHTEKLVSLRHKYLLGKEKALQKLKI